MKLLGPKKQFDAIVWIISEGDRFGYVSISGIEKHRSPDGGMKLLADKMRMNTIETNNMNIEILGDLLHSVGIHIEDEPRITLAEWSSNGLRLEATDLGVIIASIIEENAALKLAKNDKHNAERKACAERIRILSFETYGVTLMEHHEAANWLECANVPSNGD